MNMPPPPWRLSPPVVRDLPRGGKMSDLIAKYDTATPFVVSFKLNGVRAIFNTETRVLSSKKGTPIHVSPAFAHKLPSITGGGNVVLDGELLAYGKRRIGDCRARFQAGLEYMASRIGNRTCIRTSSEPGDVNDEGSDFCVVYVVFDVLRGAPAATRNSWSARAEWFAAATGNVSPETHAWKRHETVVITLADVDGIEFLFRAGVRNGHEGIIMRHDTDEGGSRMYRLRGVEVVRAKVIVNDGDRDYTSGLYVRVCPMSTQSAWKVVVPKVHRGPQPMAPGTIVHVKYYGHTRRGKPIGAVVTCVTMGL